MTPFERAEQLLPLGLLNPPGTRGHRPVSRAADPRRDALPTFDEANRCPDATYAFRDATGDSFRLDASAIVTIQATSVASNEGPSASGEIVTRAWTSAWRTGLVSWTNSVEDLVGAWVCCEEGSREKPAWMSLREIVRAEVVDLLVWLPHWSEWRRLPKRVQPPAEVVPLHPSPLGMEAVHAHHDARFEHTRGPCANFPGGLRDAAPKYLKALGELKAVHIVDRGDVKHYLHVWGETEWQGKSNLLPQASVVFVHGPGDALDAFYEWMRHVELPVYPVLHDVEWAREHDHEKAYQPKACGHPSLLASPEASVAVAVVFGDDLAALREVLVKEFGAPCTEDTPPDWVPCLIDSYDHVLAIDAGWALTDARVGWRAYSARRPLAWYSNPGVITVSEWNRRAATDRRWGQALEHTPSGTDRLGRLPIVRWDTWGTRLQGTNYWARCRSVDLLEMCRLLTGEVAADIEIKCEASELAIVRSAGSTLFFIDGGERVVARGGLSNGSLSSIVQLSDTGLTQRLHGKRCVAWRRLLRSTGDLNQAVLRQELASVLQCWIAVVDWTKDGEFSTEGRVIGHIDGLGVIHTSSGLHLDPGDISTHESALAAVHSDAISASPKPRTISEGIQMMLSCVEFDDYDEGRTMAQVLRLVDQPDIPKLDNVHLGLTRLNRSRWYIVLLVSGSDQKPSYSIELSRYFAYSEPRWGSRRGQVRADEAASSIRRSIQLLLAKGTH